MSKKIRKIVFLASSKAHASSVRGAVARAAVVCLGLLARVMVATGLVVVVVGLLLAHDADGSLERMRTRVELSLQLINFLLLLLAESGVLAAGVTRNNFMLWSNAVERANGAG